VVARSRPLALSKKLVQSGSGGFSTDEVFHRKGTPVPQKALTENSEEGTIRHIARSVGSTRHLQRMEALLMMRTFHSKILAWVLIAAFPAAMFAADTPGAMLYSHGTALLNGNNIARSSAIFLGDLVQTNPDSVANISATGSSVIVLNDSLIQFEGSRVKVEHGGVTVSTSKLMSARAGLVNVLPASGVLTEFEVRDVDGSVHIVARKGNLTISDGSGVTTLAQGQQTTRDEGISQDDSQAPADSRKKKKRQAAGTVPGASGGVLNSPVAIGIGGGIIVGGTIWVLTKNDDPVSPAKP